MSFDAPPSHLARSARRYDVILTAFLTLVSGVVTAVIMMVGAAPDSAIHVPPSYDAQVAQLAATQQNLHALMAFIEIQKRKLVDERHALEALQSERARLRPILAADRRTIEAVFAIQEQRNVQRQTRERWLGFAFGVFSSLIATLVWSVTTRAFARRRDHQP